MTIGVECDIIQGDLTLSQGWSLQFHGDANAGPADSLAVQKHRCKAALQALRISPTAWVECWAWSPDDEWVQIFVAADKSPMQRATEVGTKRLHEILSSMVPADAGPLKALKPEGVIFHNWVPLVRLLTPAAGVNNLEWNQEQLQALGLDKSRVEELLLQALAENNPGNALRARIARTPWRP